MVATMKQPLEELSFPQSNEDLELPIENSRAELIYAPFTHEQVVALNEYQRAGWMHPFTCGICRDRLGTCNEKDEWVDDRKLVATINGWICPTCDYTQNWCHDFMLKGRPDDALWRSLMGFGSK